MILRQFLALHQQLAHHRYFFFGFIFALFTTGCSQPLPFPPIKPVSNLVVLSPSGPLSYEPPLTPEKKGTGFGYELVALFAKTLDLDVQVIPTTTDEITGKLREHTGHLAVGWIHPDENSGLIAGATIAETQDILVQHQSSPAIRSINELKAQKGKTIYVAKGSHAAFFISNPKRKNGDSTEFPLPIKAIDGEDAFQLLEKVANQEIDFAIVDKATYSIALNYFPSLDTHLKVSAPYPISWLFPEKSAPLLIEKANTFIRESQNSGEIHRLLDRYLGHLERLTPNDNATFIERIQSTLPQYRHHFIAAQEQTGIDWRLLAAIAYRESGWDPLATSHTNVRGIMMLTEDTASHLGVKDRLDARQSILAGARYLQSLRRKISANTPEPDRTWQALAAYNLGPTNFQMGRQFAEKNSFNPDNWYDMKKALPRFARIHRARGGEAVIMVESTRLLYDTLKRYEQPHISRPKAKNKSPNRGKTPAKTH